MTLEITDKYLKYNFDSPSTYAFNGVAINYFVRNVLGNRKDKMSEQILFRLTRTGLIGDILFKAASQNVLRDDHGVEHEILAALFESYLVQVRSIFDYLLIFMEQQYRVEQKSFSKFLKKIKSGEYENIEHKFRLFLKNESFSDLKDFRDSVVHKTANIHIHVKKEEYRVEGNLYRDDKTVQKIDESLYNLVFGYTTTLLLLMSYIAEKETGKTLSEQLQDSTEYVTKTHRDKT